jgi:hypothetical protein
MDQHEIITLNHTSRKDLLDLLRRTEDLDEDDGRLLMLADALRSLVRCLPDRGALELRPLRPPPEWLSVLISVSINTVLRSLTPAQLNDPAILRADCASPLLIDATDPGPVPLDRTESKAVLASSSSPLTFL